MHYSLRDPEKFLLPCLCNNPLLRMDTVQQAAFFPLFLRHCPLFPASTLLLLLHTKFLLFLYLLCNTVSVKNHSPAYPHRAVSDLRFHPSLSILLPQDSILQKGSPDFHDSIRQSKAVSCCRMHMWLFYILFFLS